MQKRCLKRNVDEDRISGLPDHLLHEIYSSLETIYYVQSSVLSKRWKNLWKSTPNLYFHHRWDTFRFMNNFADQVLDRRDHLNISTFRFSGLMDPARVEIYICYAIAHNAQVFNICCSINDIQFPQCFASSKSIRVLELKYMKLPLSLGSETLKSLHFNKCFLPNYASGELISNFPNLETLILSNFSIQLPTFIIRGVKLKYLEVSIDGQSCESISLYVFAPKLTTFKYETQHHSTLSMGNVPLIEQVYVSFHKSVESVCPIGISDNDVALHLIKILKELCNAKSVTLSFSTLKALRMEPISLLDKIPSPFCKVEHLKLKCDDLMQRRQKEITFPTQVLFHLLKNSPSAVTTMTGFPKK